MLVVMVRIPLGAKEEGERFVERFKNRAGLVDQEPGFLGFELLRSDTEIISMTRWASREDLDRWMGSQANAQAHASSPQPTGGGHPGAEQGQGHSPSQGQATSRPVQAGAMGSVLIYEVVIPAGEQA